VAGLGPVHLLVGVLVIVLAYVTLYVLTNNTISQRKSQLTALNQQLSQEQAQIARLNSYTRFEKLAQQRAETVRQITASRFDWHRALSDLSKVMPANASLQSVLATVAPGASVSGAGGSTAAVASSGSVRGDINSPAFEIKGCTASQDDVARLVSRLRLINDVQRVTLEDSAKAAGSSATAPAASPAGTASSSGGCPANWPTFDLVVFFQPLPGALPTTGTAQPASPAGTPSAAATTAQGAKK
jgi:Tfp pilus assembly protein PilN